MTKQKDISIIIVNYNTYNFLRKCLQSIREQDTQNLDIEIIVVDNNSKDDSAKLIKKNEKDVRFIKNRQNLGFAKANNKGIKCAKGKYILLVNPDTVFLNNVLEKLHYFMEKNKSVAVSTAKILLESGEIDDACHRGFPTPWRAFCQFIGLSTLFPKSRLFNGYHLGYQDMHKTHEIDSCSGAFMMIRRSSGQSVDWLDEDYFWYGEDLDFCFRIKKKGWRVMFLPHLRIRHYRGVSSGIKKHTRKITTASRETQKRALFERYKVMEIFYNKHYSDKYPNILKKMVFFAISTKRKLNLLMHRVNL